MIGGIVEIADAGRHVSVHRGFVRVSEGGDEIGCVPLDDVTALILSGPQTTLSKQLMVELAERKAVIVTCGRNWHPLSPTLPLGAHFESAGILHDQISARAPLKKRLWQHLVRVKIQNQSTILACHAPDHAAIAKLSVLARRVRSGDPENMEAQAARYYWPALMGKEFRRDRFATDANVHLNYGYTVLRAAMARAVCAAGLHPALGLHHHSRVNAFALVDDLIEPFRPLVDTIACELRDLGVAGDLNPERKRRLAAVFRQDLIGERGASPLVNCLARLAQSVATSLAKKSDALVLPEFKLADQLA